MIFDIGERLCRVGSLPPRVVKVERSAMVDKPQFFVPPQHIGISYSAVYVHQQRIEPHDLRSEPGRNLCDKRIEGYGTGKVMQSQVESGAGLQQVLDLLISLRTSEGAVAVGKHYLRSLQPQCAGRLSTDEFRNERLPTPPRPAKFQHVQEIVITLHASRKWPAFPQ